MFKIDLVSNALQICAFNTIPKATSLSILMVKDMTTLNVYFLSSISTSMETCLGILATIN